MKPSSSSTSRKESKRKRKKKALQADQSAPKKKPKPTNQDDDPYSHLDSATAAALRKDDEEIAALEAKMGLTSSKEKKRLHKEYAKLNGYGDDFGDFLDSVDTLVARVNDKQEEEDYESYQQKYGLLLEEEEGEEDTVGFQYTLMDSEDEDDEDEIVPMKDTCMDSEEEEEMLQQNHESGESDSSEDEEDEDEDDEQNKPENRQQSSSGGDDSDGSSDGDEQPDHHIQDTYRPSQGEDIYGNPLHQKDQGPAPKKYVPPHLRKKQDQDASQHDQADQVRQREVQRLLNNSLNRLSENTMISVAQAIATSLYPSYPTAIVNECIWKNLRIACIERPHLMTGLIPVYVACLSGVHVQMGDKAQVGEYLLEHTVTDLWNEIDQSNNNSAEKLNDDDTIQKDASNLILVLCYLYNYGIVHCSFLYSVIRRFIESFREIEVELLLLILSHCGRSLRSDDPTALKEIVLTVQKRALQAANGALSSRVEYMISAMMDLKNNKKRKADVAHAEKVSKLRKLLGQIKSSSGSRSADSLRIGLDDILNVGTKGRWWKVGASWVGNQYRFEEGGDAAANSRSSKEQSSSSSNDDTNNNNKEDAKLLKLAAKARMNTDAKRAIFCIIMKSADCEDAFEKLSRAGHMKNRKERDAVRVLMECCGNEKTYNPFYAHLGARMCEYQPQCKFSMQLAYWDVFKQFDDGDSVSARKAANLAKLAFHLVVIQPSLKLGVLKALDMSSPDELSEASVIFLTIFFSKLLEHFDNPSDVRMFLENEVKKKKGNRGGFDADDDDANDMIGGNESMGELNDDNDDGGLGPSISIFLLQTLKASPKYKKGSRFKTNLKAAVKACDTEDFFF